MSLLFSPYKTKSITLKNRAIVSPMCQYMAEDGMPNDWHLVHYGSRAVGGAGAIVQEATAVSPEGRISPDDLGIWSDAHAQAYQRITAFIKAHGSVPGVQLAHAGRKASMASEWKGGQYVPPEAGGWVPVGPSAVPFGEGYAMPIALERVGLDKVIADFCAAAKRALAGGFDIVEIHAAHGYLLHEFLSPLSNHRTDTYGGSLENRMRFPLEVVAAVRAVWPKTLPLWVRISATDWAEGGWDAAQSVVFCRELKAIGVDLIDVSTGALVPHAKIPVGVGFQVPFSEKIRTEAAIATGAVGLISEPSQMETILATGQADLIFIGREFLREPYFPIKMAHRLHSDADWPLPYRRAK